MPSQSLPGFKEDGPAKDSKKTGLPRNRRRRACQGFKEDGPAQDSQKTGLPRI